MQCTEVYRQFKVIRYIVGYYFVVGVYSLSETMNVKLMIFDFVLIMCFLFPILFTKMTCNGNYINCMTFFWTKCSL